MWKQKLVLIENIKSVSVPTPFLISKQFSEVQTTGNKEGIMRLKEILAEVEKEQEETFGSLTDMPQVPI